MSLPHALSVVARVTRVAELASAAVVVGIVSHFLHYYEDNTAYPNVRLVYTEVVAVLSMLCSILWIVFQTAEFYSVGADIFISLAWFAAFGSLMEYVDCHHCTTSPFNIHYGNKIGNGLCNEWRATEAFAFITGVFFLGNAIFIIYAESLSHKRRPTTSSPGVVEGGSIATDVQTLHSSWHDKFRKSSSSSRGST